MGEGTLFRITVFPHWENAISEKCTIYVWSAYSGGFRTEDLEKLFKEKWEGATVTIESIENTGIYYSDIKELK